MVIKGEFACIFPGDKPLELKVAEFPKLALKHGILLNLPI